MRFEKLIKRTVIFGTKALKIRVTNGLSILNQTTQDQDQDRKQAITSPKKTRHTQ